ncbi:unnamed protein product [Closterium sp. NIES-53]
MPRWAVRRLLAIAAAVTSLLLSALLALINSANAAASCSAFRAAHPLPLPHTRFSPLRKPPPHQLATPAVQTEALAHRALMRRHPAATAAGAAGVNAVGRTAGPVLQPSHWHPFESPVPPFLVPIARFSPVARRQCERWCSCRRRGACGRATATPPRRALRGLASPAAPTEPSLPCESQRSRPCPVSRNGAVLALDSKAFTVDPPPTGTIPAAITDLATLQYLDMTYSINLVGAVPSLSPLTRLTHLYVSHPPLLSHHKKHTSHPHIAPHRRPSLPLTAPHRRHEQIANSNVFATNPDEQLP